MDFSQIDPQQLQAILDLGSLDENQAMLQQQMEQAQALQQGSGQHHTTGLGAALGGLADVINAYTGSKNEKQIRSLEKDVIAQKAKGRKAYADALFGLGGGGGGIGVNMNHSFNGDMGGGLSEAAPFSYGQPEGQYGYSPDDLGGMGVMRPGPWRR